MMFLAFLVDQVQPAADALFARVSEALMLKDEVLVGAQSGF